MAQNGAVDCGGPWTLKIEAWRVADSHHFDDPDAGLGAGPDAGPGAGQHADHI
jgi:hypothetical protein